MKIYFIVPFVEQKEEWNNKIKEICNYKITCLILI